MSLNLTHLQQLESESIHIIREVVAEFGNPVMLYSIGKASAVKLHLARQAFHPASPPFPPDAKRIAGGFGSGRIPGEERWGEGDEGGGRQE